MDTKKPSQIRFFAQVFCLFVFVGNFSVLWGQTESSPPADFLNFVSKVQRAEVLERAERERKNWPSTKPLELLYMNDLGVRRAQGRYIDFYTDLPETPETQSVFTALEAAVPLLCRYFHLDEWAYDDWKIEAFLMSEREPFEIFGALEGAPEFPNGYSLYRRIWVFDKKSGYYNRFLMIHELVHAFMYSTFGSLEPRWYSEGIAEFLALHRWDGQRLELGIFPESAEEVAGFGRVDRIAREVRAGNFKPLNEIWRFDYRDYEDVGTYAWSWALVLLLARSERYADAFSAMPYLMTDEDPTGRFQKFLGEKAEFLPADWNDLLRHFDYGYDFKITAIDYSSGQTPEAFPVSFDLDISSGGWVNSQIRLEAGKSYRISVLGAKNSEAGDFLSEGAYSVYDSRRMLPCRSNGITLRYHRGEPLGRLLAGSWDGTAWQIEPFTSKAAIEPRKTGPLYLRVNLPTGEISRAKGAVRVEVGEK